MVWQSHICNKTAIVNLPPLLNSTSSSPSPPWYLHWCRANMGGNSHHRCQKWWILKWRKITKNVKSMKEVTFCKKKNLTSSDLVTNSYGESCDLYSEKLRVLVHIQWVPVRKTRSPKLKMLEPLCNQTVNLEKDAKTLYYWHNAQLHYNSLWQYQMHDTYRFPGQRL